MAAISSSVGLISGINTGDIINQLMAIEQQPVTDLQNRIQTINNQQAAYTDLQTRIASLQLTGTLLKKPSTFQATTATSSDQSVLTATTTVGAQPGNYQFQVARTVTTQQAISSGFSDYNSTPVGAGKLTIELGNGTLNSTNNLDSLNGGAGVRRGSFRVTDREGHSAVIDISDALTLDDVVNKINNSLDVSVHASVSNNSLVLQDLSGGTGSLSVQDVAGNHAATDLGIATNVSGSTLTGTSINTMGRSTSASTLRDGRGIRTANGASDFTVKTSDGSTTSVALGAVSNVGQIIDAINKAGGTKFHATIDTTTNSITLVDDTTPDGTDSLSVAAVGNSKAASDLGFTNTTSGNTISGNTILTALGTVSLSALNGGSGITTGKISITDRAGNTAQIDLSGAQTVQDILDGINNSGLGVQASLNSSGNGIQIVDTTGQSGNIVISDVSGTMAQQLNLTGSFDTNTTAINSGNMQKQWASEQTLLSSYNGGKGVPGGSIRINNPNYIVNGQSASVVVNLNGKTKLGDVIAAINASNAGVTASINSTGDGLLLTNTAGGSGSFTVSDVDSTTAAALNISGTATNGQINGSFEKTIDITATDTLSSVQQKISQLNFGVTAQIINDGSADTPFRLMLSAKNSGTGGSFVFDGGTTGISTQNLTEGHDAAVFVGSATSAKPLLITASSNTINGIVPGVNITLNSASTSPVSLTISPDSSQITTQIDGFVSAFNDLVDKINSYDTFDSSTNTPGLLLGDSAVEQIETTIYQGLQGFIGTQYTGNSSINSFASVGLTVGDGGKLSFDDSTFTNAMATDPNAVMKLFTAYDQQASTTSVGSGTPTVTLTPNGSPTSGSQTNPDGSVTTFTLVGRGLGYLLENSFKSLVDPTTGVIPVENNTLAASVSDFQDRITYLNTLLDQKRSRLEEQFANMESALATLQSQGQALDSLTGATSSSSSKSSSSSSSSSKS